MYLIFFIILKNVAIFTLYDLTGLSNYSIRSFKGSNQLTYERKREVLSVAALRGETDPDRPTSQGPSSNNNTKVVAVVAVTFVVVVKAVLSSISEIYSAVDVIAEVATLTRDEDGRYISGYVRGGSSGRTMTERHIKKI